MQKINTTQMVRMLVKVCDTVASNQELLSKLDSFVGDGDHGVTVARGFTAVKNRLLTTSDISTTLLLEAVGDTLSETMGGAIGPIFGALFSGMATHATDLIGADDMAAMFRAGLESVTLIGGAKQGDSTLVDALAPAVYAMENATSNFSTLRDSMQDASKAARAGAEATRDMIAKKGRAKFLQEKSLGYQDAGATSMAIVIETMAIFCANENA